MDMFGGVGHLWVVIGGVDCGVSTIGSIEMMLVLVRSDGLGFYLIFFGFIWICKGGPPSKQLFVNI